LSLPLSLRFILSSKGWEDAMNRTLAVAILVAALAALTSPAYACMTMPGFEPINSGKPWKSWPSSDRLSYLLGFQDGSSHVVFQLGPIDENTKKTAQKTALRYDLTQIRDVMTRLYSDPANAYIGVSAMVFIARDILDGKIQRNY
jgi:hypothetical protein